MINFSRSRKQKFRVALIATFGVTLVSAATFLSQAPKVSLSREALGIAIPFGTVETPSIITAAMTKIGRKSNVDVHLVEFPNELATETLRGEGDPDRIIFALVDNSPTITHGASLAAALKGKGYGYLYTDIGGTTENARRRESLTNPNLTLGYRFPGTFFSSYRDDSIMSFERAHGIVFKDIADVPLQRNARYIIVANGPTTMRVRNVQSPLNKASMTFDVNNDGRVTQRDRTLVIDDLDVRGARPVTMNMTAPPYLDVKGSWFLSADNARAIADWLTTNAYCGNTKTETGETCDDGNETSGDGCSEMCQKENSPLFNASLPKDVNNDGSENRVDYDVLLENIENFGDRPVTAGMTGPPYPDTNNDRHIGHADVFFLINSTPWCGNKKTESPEECDDANTVDDDFCTNNCKIGAAAPF